MQARNSATAEQLTTALLSRYARDVETQPTLDTDSAISLLESMAPDLLVEHPTLHAAISAHDSSAELAPRERAIVSSIDDCLKMINAITSIDSQLEGRLRTLLIPLARELVRQPHIALTDSPSALSVLDHLHDGLVGWTEGLGKAGEKLVQQLDHAATSLPASTDVAELDASLAEFFAKEQARIGKLEERLAASETGRLRSKQSRAFAASMINTAMARKQLTPALVHFLQGPWFDSAQLLVLTKGFDSEEWSRMKALTETLVWTYQPIDAGNADQAQKEKQRLYRIVEHMPGEIRELLESLQHDTTAIESALEHIEQDHVLLVSGQSLEYSPFTPIESEEEEGARPTVSRLLLRKLQGYEPGQWFSFKSDDLNARIKLLLKLDDVKLILFTNRNGMKVMQCTFEEFAYYLSSSAAKPLAAGQVFSGTFRAFYEGLITEHAKQQKRIAERKAERDREQEDREQARQKALQEAADLARQQEEDARDAQLRAREQRLEAAKKALADAEPEVVERVTAAVSDLSVGAWLKLPGPLGTLEDCKLAVKISATDKMIFVSQSGTKIGEYTSDELTRLLVAGQGEIQDEGVEFEDTLQQVVSRLRQDKSKSYDDLTGE